MDKASIRLSVVVENELRKLGSAQQATLLSGFFKCGEGEYACGDRFLGVKVPLTRRIVKCYKDRVELRDIDELLHSEWHEVRFAGLLFLIEIYKGNRSRKIVDWYIDRLKYGNNWDLVDVVCPNILGDWVVRHPEDASLIYSLAESDNLWEQRVSVVSTLALIRSGRFDVTLDMSLRFLSHPHDLMHKAVGWMLREVGKRDEQILMQFLDENGRMMPRTTLRYAIEKLTEPVRQHYLLSTR